MVALTGMRDINGYILEMTLIEEKPRNNLIKTLERKVFRKENYASIIKSTSN